MVSSPPRLNLTSPYAGRIAENWPPHRKIPDSQLLEAFPNMAEVINVKLAELYDEREYLCLVIHIRSEAIKALRLDGMSEWFGLRWLDLNNGEDLRNVDKTISRLSRQLHFVEGRPQPPGSITDDLIQKAKEFPLAELIEARFQKRGKTLACLCPFHEDKRPSFHIYIAQNRGWCFGCNRGGDAIDIARQLHDYDFRQAVLFLVGSDS